MNKRCARKIRRVKIEEAEGGKARPCTLIACEGAAGGPERPATCSNAALSLEGRETRTDKRQFGGERVLASDAGAGLSTGREAPPLSFAFAPLRTGYQDLPVKPKSSPSIDRDMSISHGPGGREGCGVDLLEVSQHFALSDPSAEDVRPQAEGSDPVREETRRASP